MTQSSIKPNDSDYMMFIHHLGKKDRQAHYAQHKAHMWHNHIIRAVLLEANKESSGVAGGHIYAGSPNWGRQAGHPSCGYKAKEQRQYNIGLQLIRKRKKGKSCPLENKMWELEVIIKWTVCLPPDSSGRPMGGIMAVISNQTALLW